MAEPLIIKDLENIEVNGLTTQVYGLPRAIGMTIYASDRLSGWGKGKIYLDEKIYQQFDITHVYQTYFEADGHQGENITNLDIKAGDYVTLTYDGGKKLNVYLPESTIVTSPELWIATDGSTYYDPDLTQLAQLAGLQPEPEKKFPYWIFLGIIPIGLIIYILKKKK